MKEKLSVVQLITYIVLGMTLVFSILTFLKLTLSKKPYNPPHKLEVISLIEGVNLTPEQKKEINKCLDGIDEIKKQFPLFGDEEKKLKKMTKLFKKGKITEEELKNFKRGRRERWFKQNSLYHQKYLEALNVLTKKQLDERMKRLELWERKKYGRK